MPNEQNKGLEYDQQLPHLARNFWKFVLTNSPQQTRRKEFWRKTPMHQLQTSSSQLSSHPSPLITCSIASLEKFTETSNNLRHRLYRVTFVLDFSNFKFNALGSTRGQNNWGANDVVKYTSTYSTVVRVVHWHVLYIHTFSRYRTPMWDFNSHE